MNEWVSLSVTIYAAFAIFNFWVFWGYETKRGYVTRGGLGFIIFMSALGPIAIAAAVSALANGRLQPWFDKEIWRRRD